MNLNVWGLANSSSPKRLFASWRELFHSVRRDTKSAMSLPLRHTGQALNIHALILLSAIPIKYVTTPSRAPTKVISKLIYNNS
jgi:hypothetical protein